METFRIVKKGKRPQVAAEKSFKWLSKLGWRREEAKAPKTPEHKSGDTKIETPPNNQAEVQIVDYSDYTKKELTAKIIELGGNKPKPALNKAALVKILKEL